jgi:hypothetical protein
VRRTRYALISVAKTATLATISVQTWTALVPVDVTTWFGELGAGDVDDAAQIIPKITVRSPTSFDSRRLRRGVPDVNAGDHAVADVPGDGGHEGRRSLGEQSETAAPLVPEFTRSSHSLDEHADPRLVGTGG